MSTDYIYWTFSAAAQSISAFIALLLTGYALVQTLMDTARDKDDSLDDIHAALRQSYHRRMTALAWLTGCAVVLSLVVVYVNRSDAAAPVWLQTITGSLDLAAVIGGLAFVVSIVDPKKYQAAAERALEKAQGDSIHEQAPAAASEFFDAFMHLERLMREYIRAHPMELTGRGNARPGYTFRQMAEALFQNEKIGRRLSDELTDINRYRNLVFHGHVAEVDRSMLQRLRAATARIEQLG
jgi:hypothetical protein